MEKLEQGDIITLDDNKEYIAFAVATAPDSRSFVYLMTTAQPVEICFAEQTSTADGKIDLRIVGDQNEKIAVLNLFRAVYAKN